MLVMQKIMESFNPPQSPHCNGGKFCILMRPITLGLTQGNRFKIHNCRI